MWRRHALKQVVIGCLLVGGVLLGRAYFLENPPRFGAVGTQSVLGTNSVLSINSVNLKPAGLTTTGYWGSSLVNLNSLQNKNLWISLGNKSQAFVGVIKDATFQPEFLLPKSANSLQVLADRAVLYDRSSGTGGNELVGIEGENEFLIDSLLTSNYRSFLVDNKQAEIYALTADQGLRLELSAISPRQGKQSLFKLPPGLDVELWGMNHDQQELYFLPTSQPWRQNTCYVWKLATQTWQTSACEEISPDEVSERWYLLTNEQIKATFLFKQNLTKHTQGIANVGLDLSNIEFMYVGGKKLLFYSALDPTNLDKLPGLFIVDKATLKTDIEILDLPLGSISGIGLLDDQTPIVTVEGASGTNELYIYNQDNWEQIPNEICAGGCRWEIIVRP